MDSKIVVTGAAGFIGSCLVGKLNSLGFDNLVIVDDFRHPERIPNLNDKRFVEKVHRDGFFDWLKTQKLPVQAIYHIGARTDTTEFDEDIFNRLNLDYTKAIWQYSAANGVPLVYASSAATYGEGELGYSDEHSLVKGLQPLNPYGWSKHKFDCWALEQDQAPPQWVGLKFFNVYGPNEFHKGRMASVIWHAFRQINEKGTVKLFRSHRPEYRDGWQLRDFIYVKDVLDVCVYSMQNKIESGLYNLGTGKARSFYDLAASTFAAMNRPVSIEFIDIPVDIREKYQYFTEADMSKLILSGYHQPFYELESGIDDYVRNYLLPGRYY